MKKGKKGERKGGRRGGREKQRNRKRNRKKSITKNRKRDRKRNGKRKPALPLLLAPTGITPSPSLGPWLPCFQSLSSHLSSNLALPIGSPRGFPAHPARTRILLLSPSFPPLPSPPIPCSVIPSAGRREPGATSKAQETRLLKTRAFQVGIWHTRLQARTHHRTTGSRCSPRRMLPEGMPWHRGSAALAHRAEAVPWPLLSFSRC